MLTMNKDKAFGVVFKTFKRECRWSSSTCKFYIPICIFFIFNFSFSEFWSSIGLGTLNWHALKIVFWRLGDVKDAMMMTTLNWFVNYKIYFRTYVLDNFVSFVLVMCEPWFLFQYFYNWTSCWTMYDRNLLLFVAEICLCCCWNLLSIVLKFVVVLLLKYTMLLLKWYHCCYYLSYVAASEIYYVCCLNLMK